jgi:N4-gp56 family major capsid protein
MSGIIDLPIGDPDAAVAFSTTLYQQVQTQQNWMNLLSGPAPTVSAEAPTGQSEAGYPITKVIDLTKGTADTVQVKLSNQLHGKPVVGDQVLAGKFMQSEFSRMLARVNQLRGAASKQKMSQHRTVHDLRTVAQKLLAQWTVRVNDQRALVHLAGARGGQTIQDWEIPLASDPDFASILVNPITAPTRNRRFVVGSAMGGSVADIGITDVLSLQDVSDVISQLQSSQNPLAPVVIEDDKYDWNATHVLFVPMNVWNLLKRPKALVDWKSALATTIARFDGSRKHPLFTGECIMWNNVLIKPMDRYAITFAPGSTVTADSGGSDGYTYTETTETVPTTSANHYVARSILLGAQALVQAFGSEGQDSYMWRWNEEFADHKNSVEISVSMIDGFQKAKFRIAGQDTDMGVATIDSYAPPIMTAEYIAAMAL